MEKSEGCDSEGSTRRQVDTDWSKSVTFFRIFSGLRLFVDSRSQNSGHWHWWLSREHHQLAHGEVPGLPDGMIAAEAAALELEREWAGAPPEPDTGWTSGGCFSRRLHGFMLAVNSRNNGVLWWIAQGSEMANGVARCFREGMAAAEAAVLKRQKNGPRASEISLP